VNPKARSDARGADQTGAAGRRLKQVAPNALTGPKRLSDRVGHVASVEIAHWAATALGILIVKNQLVKNQRPSAADQNGKAAAIAPAQYSVNYTAGSGIDRGFRRLV
jgi:hypothetical protein